MKKLASLCLILSLFFSACGKKAPKTAMIRPVMTEKVELIFHGPSIHFSGFTKSEKFIAKSFRLPGKIQTLYVKVGDKLRLGAPIASLDPTDFELEYTQAIEGFKQAESEHRKELSNFRRIRSLYESESASRDELDSARAAYEMTKANVAKTAAQADLAQKRLSYTEIFAELDDSEVVSKEVEVNQNVTTGETVVTLAHGTSLEIEMAVSETFISSLELGDVATVCFPVLKDKCLEAFITEIGPKATDGTVFPVTLRLNEKHPDLRPGMAAKITVETALEDNKPVIIAPLEAVGKDESGHFVYLFQEEGESLGLAKKHAVTIGQMQPSGFVIKQGLNVGDEVITAGLRFLESGKKVRRLPKAFKPFKERL